MEFFRARYLAAIPATPEVRMAVMMVPSMMALGYTVAGSLSITMSRPRGIPGCFTFSWDSAAHLKPAMFSGSM